MSYPAFCCQLNESLRNTGVYIGEQRRALSDCIVAMVALSHYCSHMTELTFSHVQYHIFFNGDIYYKSLYNFTPTPCFLIIYSENVYVIRDIFRIVRFLKSDFYFLFLFYFIFIFFLSRNSFNCKKFNKTLIIYSENGVGIFMDIFFFPEVCTF